MTKSRTAKPTPLHIDSPDPRPADLLSPSVVERLERVYSANDEHIKAAFINTTVHILGFGFVLLLYYIGLMFKPILVPVFWAFVLAIPLRQLKRGLLKFVAPLEEEEDTFFRMIHISKGSSTQAKHTTSSSRARLGARPDSVDLRKMTDPPRVALGMTQRFELAKLKLKAFVDIISHPFGGSVLPATALVVPLVAASSYMAAKFSSSWFLLPVGMAVACVTMMCFQGKESHHTIAAIFIVSCLVFAFGVFFFFFMTKCVQEVFAFLTVLSQQFESLKQNKDYLLWLESYGLSVEVLQDRISEVRVYVIDTLETRTGMTFANITEIAQAFKTNNNTAHTASAVLAQLQSGDYMDHVKDGLGYLRAFNPVHIFKSLGVASYGIVSLLISFSQSMVNFIGFVVIFFTVLFYLLQWERSPIGIVSKFLPVDAEMRKLVSTHINDSVSGVFICSFVLCLVNALATWISFTIAGAPFIYINTFISAFFGLFPVLAPYVVCLPTVIFLWIQGSYTSIGVIVAFQLALFLYTENIYRLVGKDLKPHPYIVGMSVVMGLYQYGFNGVLIGPLLVCIFLTTFNVFTAYTG